MNVNHTDVGTATSQGGPEKARDRWSVPPEAVEEMVRLSSMAVELFSGRQKATPPVQDKTGVRGLGFDRAHVLSRFSILGGELVRSIYVRHGLSDCAKALDQDIQDVPLEILEMIKSDLLNIGCLLGICLDWAIKTETSTTHKSLQESSDAKKTARSEGGRPETGRKKHLWRPRNEIIRDGITLLQVLAGMDYRWEDLRDEELNNAFQQLSTFQNDVHWLYIWIARESTRRYRLKEKAKKGRGWNLRSTPRSWWPGKA